MNQARCSTLTVLSLVATAAAFATPVWTVPADNPPDFVPLGAYVSWERVGANAQVSGIDKWADACRRLDALQASHVNLLWVTNMSETDLPRLIEECGKRGMKLLPSMSTVEAKVDWRWANDGAYYDKVLPNLLKVAGPSETLVGWVLSDEPKEEQFPRLEMLRQCLRELDPNRFCTSVTMWPQTPEVPAQTKLPVVCVDLYPFFGPNDPNGPHTDAASKSFFRRNAAKMIEAIGDRNALGWVMGMCFSDLWGPRKYDAQGHLVGLPGSYLHWRCPTLAEMRWQVWETVRSGAKGFVCYTLAPEAPNSTTETLPPPDVTWKDVLAKEVTDLGPNALTNPDGSPTPQLEELGRVYARLAPHTALIRRWRLSSAPVVETEGSGQVQAFADPETGAAFAVLLNDELHEDQTIAVRVGETTSSVRDLLRDQDIALKRDFAGGSGTGAVALRAGQGTILQLGDNRPGGR
ncbi:MAG: hypothetical protein AUJ96_28575 [Armatimonadetes bacterium CG2_30_66_41]|nr:MAG: hypothetical protein AUJ96_28575 [Armatimonadetes bacterium CG2_30_66_41]